MYLDNEKKVLRLKNLKSAKMEHWQREEPDTVLLSQFKFSQLWLCYLFARFFLMNVLLFVANAQLFTVLD